MPVLEMNVMKRIATISQGNEGEYSLELNLISWNGNEPKLDLRRWRRKQDGSKIAQKGLTLTSFELEALNKTLSEILKDK